MDDNNKTKPGFEWTTLYPKIAKKLLEKVSNENNIVDTICKRIADVPKAIKGKNDPFSFFALFHGGLSLPTLQQRLKQACSALELNEETYTIPSVPVRGIPSISFRSFEFNKEKSVDIRRCLWDFFVAAMNYADAQEKEPGSSPYEELKNKYKAIAKKEQFKPTTTVVLFLMRPETFLPLDSNTRAYLKKTWGSQPKDWPTEENTDPTYTAVLNGTAPSAEQYLSLCEYVNGKLKELKTSDGRSISNFAELSHEAWQSSSFAQAFELLESNHQIILTGAPGTGKTHTAKQVAKAFVDENESFKRFTGLIPGFNEAYGVKNKKKALTEFFKKLGEKHPARQKYIDGELDFVEKLPDYGPKKWQEKLFTARVQFHPGYDYSDFVIGMKPEIVDGKDGAKSVSFHWKDGIFKKFADRARTVYDAWCDQKDPKEAPKFVFIIDEINRADLSRVFGELFSLLEGSYRYSRGTDGEDDDEKSDENSITLPNGDEFVIPENLYIIGTMNDIDRSVESMDFALRRRFAWLEVTAKQSESIIDAWAEEEDVDSAIVEKLKKAMEALNKKVREDKKLGPEYELGGAYFKKFGDGKTEDRKESYERLWDNHLCIILSEYLRGNHDRVTLLDKLHQVYIEGCGYGKKKPDNEVRNGEQGAATA